MTAKEAFKNDYKSEKTDEMLTLNEVFTWTHKLSTQDRKGKKERILLPTV